MAGIQIVRLKEAISEGWSENSEYLFYIFWQRGFYCMLNVTEALDPRTEEENE